MATVEEIRTWAQAEGYEVGAKGRIPATVRTAYDAAHPGTNGTGAGPDYPDDDFESAFADMPEDPDMGETPPRRPKATTGRGGSKGRSWFTRSSSAKGKKKPRVSTEELLGSVWRGLAKLATPLPPLQRTLRVQAPVAGILLEDAVKGTAVDVLLQPFARFAQGGKVASALLGPPMIVTSLSLYLMRCEAQETAPNALLIGAGQEALRSSLMAWMDVAGPKFQEAMAREREFESKYGQDVDAFIAFLFSEPPASQADVEAEEAAIRRAQGIVDAEVVP